MLIHIIGHIHMILHVCTSMKIIIGHDVITTIVTAISIANTGIIVIAVCEPLVQPFNGDTFYLWRRHSQIGTTGCIRV